MRTSIILTIAILLGGIGAQAQSPSYEMRLRNAEQQIYNLRQRNMDLESRVQSIENFLYNNPVPPPLEPRHQVCVSINSNSNLAYVAKSLSRIEAETGAKNNCVAAGYGSYCEKVVCDAEDVRDHTCKMSNSNSNNDYLGKARSLVEAKAKARNSCVASGYGSYCSEQSVVCD